MENLKVEYLNIDELKPYEKNAKLHPKEQVKQIKESIKQFGMDDPIAVWGEENLIVEGHGRLMACKELGYTEVPIIRLDHLTEEQRKAYTLVHNKTTMNSDFDIDLLNLELESIVDIDMEDFGFDLGEEFNDEVEDDGWDAPLPEEPKSVRGDLWKLGRHRLLCGDSTSFEDVATLMDGELADLLITDPPYNVDYTGKTKDALKIENDKMDNDSFRQFLRDAYSTADSVMRPGACFYIWHADSEGYNFRGACADIGWKVRQCLIWQKNSMVLGRQDYQWQHEPCQPAGTMVWTPNGKVPIEELKDGDRVISYDSAGSAVRGYKDGYEIKTASRHYNGLMYGIHAGGKMTRATDNHQFSVRFNPETSEVYSTYLMRKGDRWRVGITKTYDARGFGLKHRVAQKSAEEAWIICTYKSMADAQMGGRLLACKYGIPYTHWEMREPNDNYNHRTKEQIDWLYSNLDAEQMRASAIRLLHDAGRSEKYPLVSEANKQEKFSRIVTAKINACNLIPGLMEVPVAFEKYEGTKTFEWATIEAITTEQFDGTVYSLAVDKYEHYISDGIVTHNCLYGWKDGSGHLWNSDRKQTTLLEFKRPTVSKLHPTMKPIPLFDYQIKNSAKPGDKVLDLFNGSGTTIMACEQNGRCGYGMELDPRYVDATVMRYADLAGTSEIYLIRDGEKVPFAETELCEVYNANTAEKAE